MEDLEAFGRLITALRPWLAQVVVVGGWAHRLHRFHPLANPAAHLPLRTRDADVAFPLDAALPGDIQVARLFKARGPRGRLLPMLIGSPARG